jgi:UDP-3-O-[3-hydroxymyristoyl] glucosamine N-acyltransferase
MSDVPAGVDVIGSPAMPVREFFRNVAVLRRLARRSPSPEKAPEKAAEKVSS